MLHSVAGSFGAFFVLRFLLGTNPTPATVEEIANDPRQECVNHVSPRFLS